MLAAFALSLISSSTTAYDFQRLDSIYSTAYAYLASQYEHLKDFEISIHPLDRRLKLPQCSQPLEGFIPNESIGTGRITVGIRCNGAKPWTVFTSGQVKQFLNVIVLTQPVRRGQTISRKNVMLKNVEVTHTDLHYFTGYDQVSGKQASRHLPSGAILDSRVVIPAKIIKRGEKVTIQASSEGLTITMSGYAMTDGVKDQRISVKNATSNRVIEAKVIKSGLVSVTF